MTQAVYAEQILEKAVKPWLEARHKFAIEEDGDSGHGPSQKNPVQALKEKHGLKHYFNVSRSLDLAIIENCWQPPKQYVYKYPHRNDVETEVNYRGLWAG